MGRDGQIVSKNIITQFQSGQSLKSIGFKSGDQLCVPDKAPHTFTFREDFSCITLSLNYTTGITVYRHTDFQRIKKIHGSADII